MDDFDALTTKIRLALRVHSNRAVGRVLGLSPAATARLGGGLSVLAGTRALALANEHDLDALLAAGGVAA